ncbi:diaminopimelate decarboxylase [Paludicola sp. MB14-C6]|uniref:diaminopimelate decarboxylase n=1 Tax=Paludihabitans sp. MB14-C6 TaxID=3070656 RepID=UPI0027DD6B92|nr:diaminopimelate decarboxylase [Paludicola sp. MB14-C6]WMJ24111.1 diaminopimelate decarboxylase [Paludicola sp. MB14-C6]
MSFLNHYSKIDSATIATVAKEYGTPVYLYDENTIREKCQMVLSMPNAFGLTVRYAMKANSNRTLLQTIHQCGLCIDASSLNEVRRAHLAGIPYQDIILTTQEIPENDDRIDLEQMILQGLKYNVCSLRQLYLIGDFAKANKINLSIRVHPGVGSGESASRNTGDNYSCFGIHLSDIGQALDFAKEKGILFTQVHVHIGSGADPLMWRQNIDLELDIIDRYFPDATTVSFGGGLKEARMPYEIGADVNELGSYAKQQIEAFYQRTNRKLKMEIEPGTYIVANCGYAITKVIDKKRTGNDGFNFIIANGGMEINARPIMYGSLHPFYMVSEHGKLLSSEFDINNIAQSDYEAVIVGRCCESGDSQSLDDNDTSIPRKMIEPNVGDYFVIGGTGAYCSSMTPFNYNSHAQIPEVLFTSENTLQLIRKRQTLNQIVENEI